MKPADIIKLEVYVNGTWNDYTDGIIDIGIVRGIQGYQGQYQLPESGVCTIKTRNPNMDPHSNEDIRMNRIIRITADDDVLFTGRFMQFNVDYQPKGKPQITTIIAVDIIGDMALTTLPDGFTERLGSSMDIYAMFQELEISNIIPTFNNPIREGSAFYIQMGNAAGSTASGATALQVASLLANSDMQFFYGDRFNDCYLYSKIDEKKNDVQKIQFDSRGLATSYREIELTDGFDQLINQLTIKSSRNNATIPVYSQTASVNEWGPKKLDLTISSGLVVNGVQNSESALYKDRIFSDSVYPTKEIYSIKWDGTLNVTAAATIDILDNVVVYHETDPEDIFRKYGVIGINHSITENDWEVTYYLKNFFWSETTFLTPTITVDNINPTIQDDVTWSITNLDDLILNGATYSWIYDTGTMPLSLVGTSAGTTQSITHNYTLAQVGPKNIKLVFNNGYNIPRTSATISINVVGAAPTGTTFTYSINPSDSSVYTFNATATEAQSYTFYFGDGSSRTTSTGTYTWRYSDAGPKTAYVVANNAYGTHQSASQTFTVTLPSGQGFSGNYPIRYIKLSCPEWTISTNGRAYPYFGGFTAKNYLNVNRATNGIYAWSLPYANNPNSIYSNVLWYRNDIWRSNIPQNGAISPTEPVGNSLQPNSLIAGNCQWSLIMDLQSEWYDINTLSLVMQATPAGTVNAPNLDVYVTYETGVLTNPELWHWDRLGTINKTTGVFTPAAGVIMPPTLDPINTFSYTVSSEDEYSLNNRYSFTTSNWRTDSYAWNFGDGNTSTLQNPVHNYAANGTYTVTCAKTSPNGQIVNISQNITVNGTFIEHGTMPVRYIKLEQPYYNATASAYETLTPAGGGGWTANFVFYSPTIGRFKTQNNIGTNRILNKGVSEATSVNSIPQSPYISGWYPMQPTSKDIAGLMLAPSTTPSTYNRSMTHLSGLYSGIRPAVRTMNLSAPVQKDSCWAMTFDLGASYYDIKDIYMSFNKNGTESFTTPLPTYNVYVSNTTSNPNLTANWTLVGTITPPSLDGDVNTWQEVQMIPSITMPPNL